MINQNDMEYLIEQVKAGKMTAAQANVEKVRLMRVLPVSKLTSDVRAALNAAVKAGELGHMKKSGKKPEVYYHPSFKHMANEERGRIELETLNAILRVCQ